MSDLKTVGFFTELPHGHPEGPSLRESVRGQEQVNETESIGYLRSGVLLAGAPMVLYDILEPLLVVGSAYLYTDGTWVWPSDLAYYVEKYHCALPEEFVAHMRSQGFKMPDQAEIDIDAIAKAFWPDADEEASIVKE